MKVYVVTSGSYSDYHIEAVFTDKVKARTYANLDSDREVEVYESDPVHIITGPVKARIWYDPMANKITTLTTDSSSVADKYRPDPDKYQYGELYAYRKLSDRMLKDIQMYGKKSPLLLKSMQEAWARYKYEHMNELEKDDEGKWIRVSPEEASDAFKILTGQYNLWFVSTSADMEDKANEK